jgi:hypothetical protein
MYKYPGYIDTATIEKYELGLGVFKVNVSNSLYVFLLVEESAV